MSVVLMYHSLYTGNDTSNIDDEDLPYAVSKDSFTRQLDLIAQKPSGIYNNSTLDKVVITFDDGHESNLHMAVPLLLERGLSAYFFITSGFVDSRPGFMSSPEVLELSNTAGMIVGSHGVTHRFFNDMTPDEALNELKESKALLETLTNHPCESMSFPGGRYNKSVLNQMKSAGYTQWFGSDVGMVDVSKQLENAVPKGDGYHKNLVPMSGSKPLNRVAIRRTTDINEFERMISPDPAYYRSQIRRSQAKKIIQRTLGNRLYYGLYKSVSAR